MLSSSTSCRSISTTLETYRKYKQLSPRATFTEMNSVKNVIELIKCSSENEFITPNMNLRKELLKSNKNAIKKDNIYSRSKKWQERKNAKLNGKKWDLQVSELSSCTFAPVLNKLTRAKTFNK